jgi:hypothetical protein
MILDNLSVLLIICWECSKLKQLRDIEAIFLPAYSPQFNTIGMQFEDLFWRACQTRVYSNDDIKIAIRKAVSEASKVEPKRFQLKTLESVKAFNLHEGHSAFSQTPLFKHLSSPYEFPHQFVVLLLHVQCLRSSICFQLHFFYFLGFLF